jgi:phage terminase small subunit
MGLSADTPRLNARVDRLMETGGPEAVITMLTGKQRTFVEEYIKDYNGVQALTRAGYNVKPNTAGKILVDVMRNPAVKIALAYHAKIRAEKTVVDTGYIIQKWIALVEASEAAAMDGDSKAAATFLRASELIAKSIGMFIERTEVTGAGGSAIQIEETNDAAAAFTRSIIGLASRGGAHQDAAGNDSGDEGDAGDQLAFLGKA